MTDAATQAAAEALDWRNHVFLYADDDALQYHCRWNANGDPDRLRLWQLHYAGVAVAAARPIIEAELRDAIRRRYETNTCDCGHDRSAHHSGDLGDCSDCPYGTCVAPYDKGLMWDRRHGLRDEAEVRERIAADIEAEAQKIRAEYQRGLHYYGSAVEPGSRDPWAEGSMDGLALAARIARGGAS